MTPTLALALSIGAGFVCWLLIRHAADEARQLDQDARDLAARMSRRAQRRWGDE